MKKRLSLGCLMISFFLLSACELGPNGCETAKEKADRQFREAMSMQASLRIMEENQKKIAEAEKMKILVGDCDENNISDTKLHLGTGNECPYPHWHGTFCGKPDPVPSGCGWGPNNPEDAWKQLHPTPTP